MTAINENGQVYWTFEELDLEGALEIVNKEIVQLFEGRDIFHRTAVELGSKKEYRRAKLYLDLSMDQSPKIQKLLDIVDNIVGLMIIGLRGDI